MQLITKFLTGDIPYTGGELRPHWIADQVEQFGSALVAFRGPCTVETTELVDLEDVRQGAFIRAKEMLHFLGEFFGEDMLLSIARQRLFAATVADCLRKHVPNEDAMQIYRKGDDVFFYDKDTDKTRKLTVSIVTSSPVSTLFHFGVNIDESGAPVSAVGLNRWNVDVEALTQEILETWCEEWSAQERARCKVIPR